MSTFAKHREVAQAIYAELSPLFARLRVIANPARVGWKASVKAESKGASLIQLEQLIPDLEARVARDLGLGSLEIRVELDQDAKAARELLARFLEGWRVRDVSYQHGDPPDYSYGLVRIGYPEGKGPAACMEFGFSTDDEMLVLIREASCRMPFGVQAREACDSTSKLEPGGPST